MTITMFQIIGETRPKRGDLLHTNVGDKRERTWFVLSVRALSHQDHPRMGGEAQRTKVWAERWWDVEPKTRVALHKSAERAGGQRVHNFYRFPTKQKPSPRYVHWRSYAD